MIFFTRSLDRVPSQHSFLFVFEIHYILDEFGIELMGRLQEK